MYYSKGIIPIMLVMSTAVFSSPLAQDLNFVCSNIRVPYAGDLPQPNLDAIAAEFRGNGGATQFASANYMVANRPAGLDAGPMEHMQIYQAQPTQPAFQVESSVQIPQPSDILKEEQMKMRKLQARGFPGFSFMDGHWIPTHPRRKNDADHRTETASSRPSRTLSGSLGAEQVRTTDIRLLKTSSGSLAAKQVHTGDGPPSRTLSGSLEAEQVHTADGPMPFLAVSKGADVDLKQESTSSEWVERSDRKSTPAGGDLFPPRSASRLLSGSSGLTHIFTANGPMLFRAANSDSEAEGSRRQKTSESDASSSLPEQGSTTDQQSHSGRSRTAAANIPIRKTSGLDDGSQKTGARSWGSRLKGSGTPPSYWTRRHLEKRTDYVGVNKPNAHLSRSRDVDNGRESLRKHIGAGFKGLPFRSGAFSYARPPMLTRPRTSGKLPSGRDGLQRMHSIARRTLGFKKLVEKILPDRGGRGGRGGSRGRGGRGRGVDGAPLPPVHPGTYASEPHSPASQDFSDAEPDSEAPALTSPFASAAAQALSPTPEDEVASQGPVSAPNSEHRKSTSNSGSGTSRKSSKRINPAKELDKQKVLWAEKNAAIATKNAEIMAAKEALKAEIVKPPPSKNKLGIKMKDREEKSHTILSPFGEPARQARIAVSSAGSSDAGARPDPRSDPRSDAGARSDGAGPSLRTHSSARDPDPSSRHHSSDGDPVPNNRPHVSDGDPGPSNRPPRSSDEVVPFDHAGSADWNESLDWADLSHAASPLDPAAPHSNEAGPLGTARPNRPRRILGDQKPKRD